MIFCFIATVSRRVRYGKVIRWWWSRRRRRRKKK